jgi:hypothetical protein
LSTHALRTSDDVARDGGADVLRLARWADLVLLGLALPVFALAGLPMLGYAAGAAAWLAQRAIQIVVTRRARASDDPRTVAGLLAGSMIGRGWLVALAVFGVGMLGEREDGLAAAVLMIALFTTYFTAQMFVRPFDQARGPK